MYTSEFSAYLKGPVATADGSYTIFSPLFNQHYHSLHGAVTESEHVFFTMSGFDAMAAAKSRVAIFETGFGTGMNFFMAVKHASVLNSSLYYQAVEKFPVSFDVISAVSGSFIDQNEMPIWETFFNQLHLGWNRIEVGNVTLALFSGGFAEVEHLDRPVDLIFHDSFSPEVNPDLWQKEIFASLASFSTEDAKLVSYVASVRGRAALCAAGWKVARAPGAPGKREMTIAAKKDEALSGLKRVHEETLAARWNAGEWLEHAVFA